VYCVLVVRVGGQQECVQFFDRGQPNGREQLEDLGVEGRLVLK
jgi:hypothetical protein